MSGSNKANVRKILLKKNLIHSNLQLFYYPIYNLLQFVFLLQYEMKNCNNYETIGI